MNILFFSGSGNTRYFLKRLKDYADTKQNEDTALPSITLKEITDFSFFEKESTPFFAFVPTYLNGGNGIDNGYTEAMTNTLGEYIDYAENSKLCLGIVGSGNKNFNNQYCLTAKQYAAQFVVPFLADYELRGTSKDIEKIYAILSSEWKNKFEEENKRA